MKTNGLTSRVATLVLAAGLMACGPVEGEPASTALGSAQNPLHSWGNYHWARTSNPFTLQTIDSVTATWNSYFATTVSDWSLSTGLDLVAVAGTETLNSRKKCSPTAGKIRVCNASYGRNGWLGLARIWLSGGHIAQGVAKMNDSYFTLSKYNTAAWRNHVMCQEVGHTLGLGHTSEDGSSQQTCMDYAVDPTDSQHPNAHDYEQLLLIYGHLDSSTTVALSSSAASGQDDGDNLGTRIARRGRTEHWVRPLRDGGELHTFVVLAD